MAATTVNPQFQVYDTFGRWQYTLPTPPILAVAPTASTGGTLGTVAIVPTAQQAYVLVAGAGTNNTAVWQLIESAGGAGNFTSITTTVGPNSLAGVTTLVGGFTTAANSSITGAGTFNVAGAPTLASAATTTTADIANVIPTVGRTVTVDGGLLGSAVADVLNLGNGGVNFAGSTRTANLGAGPVTIGTNTVNIGSGAVATAGVNVINIGTGTITGAGSVSTTIGSANSTTIIDGGLALANAGITAIQAHNVAGTFGGGNLTVTNNTEVGSTTASGFTTAAFAAAPFTSSTWTINNSTVLATSKIHCTASQSVADGSLMAVTSVVPNAGGGSFIVTLTNFGASAVTNTTVLTLSWIVTNV